MAAAGTKCFYFQRDHWTGSIVQGQAPELWHWDGDYFFDRAEASAASASATSASAACRRTRPPSSRPPTGPYFDANGGGGVEVVLETDPDPPARRRSTRPRSATRLRRPRPVPACIEPGGGAPRQARRPAAARRCRGSARSRGSARPQPARRASDRWCLIGKGQLRVALRAQGRAGDRDPQLRPRPLFHGVARGDRARRAHRRLDLARRFRVGGATSVRGRDGPRRASLFVASPRTGSAGSRSRPSGSVRAVARRALGAPADLAPDSGRDRRGRAVTLEAGGPGRDPLPRRADRLRRSRPGPLPRPRPQGRPGRRPGAARGVRRPAAPARHPAGIEGIDVGPDPAETPFQLAQRLAAEAWGARRSWFLVNGGSGGNHAICLALAHIGERVVVQRNVHSSTIDGLVLSGLRPRVRRPRARPGARHRPLPDARGARRGARRRARRGRRDGRLADLLRRRRRRRRARRGRPRPRRAAGRRRGLGRAPALLRPRCRPRRSSAAPTSSSPRPTRSSARSPSRRSSTSAPATGSTSASSTAP